MEKNIIRIVREFEAKIELLESEIENTINKAEEGIKITRKTLNKLREVISNSEFKSIKSEINFFKNIKPLIYSKLIYYVKLFYIESKRPRGSSKSQIKYFNSQIDKLQNYFNDNLEFYHYYRRGATFLDEHYFLRGKADIRLFPNSLAFFYDHQFATSHDTTVSTIIAYDMLIIYLKTEADKIENNTGMEIGLNTFQKQSDMMWSANKTDLVELIYALYALRAINRGTVDIKEIALMFENMFNVELGDYYRTYLEVRSRKINRTKFLDKLREALLQKMDEQDQ
ncbi:RteC protein [Tenacibaculum adriaticum]|uniref:RteC protein n=1 Tax=Tenacibaculum adriaticum TaxID=413713 RepID=A0A5S5DRH3_9FLAO|nr:RteC domain-containing protein [Tenacibaculum adriaticum]TYP97462.1 RteC protein [Tenacibaculum adriaticum]